MSISWPTLNEIMYCVGPCKLHIDYCAQHRSLYEVPSNTFLKVMKSLVTVFNIVH
jgi:biotin synthase-related radical SAM superfamily protein